MCCDSLFLFDLIENPFVMFLFLFLLFEPIKNVILRFCLTRLEIETPCDVSLFFNPIESLYHTCDVQPAFKRSSCSSS